METKSMHMTKKMRFPLILATTLGTLLLGMITGFFAGSSKGYDGLQQPPLMPPAIVFPIVWSVLYLMIGLSLYFVITAPALSPAQTSARKSAIWLWIAQMVFNLCWSFAFFTFKLYAFSFVWLSILLAINIALIINCFKFSKPAALTLIPYELWLFFAAYLALYIAIFN